MKTIEQKLEDEVRQGFPECRKWSKKQISKKIEEMRKKFIVPIDQMRLVVAYCIYNEEEYLQKSLYETMKINDVDTIHILDGAWEHGGKTINSTDATKSIIMDFKKRTGIDVIFVENPLGRLWKSESEKRNWQLKDIEQRFGQTPYYVLVRDGDEMIRWTTGRNSTWLKKDLLQWYKEKQNVGIINTYAYNSDYSTMQGIRLIPSGRGIHYYTERSMVIHDGNCNLLLNYNPSEGMQGDPTSVFMYQSFFFVNLWNMRNEKRLDEKDSFVNFQTTQSKTTEQCKYKN